jgi:D-arabinose 5-phosphate isomerase GutQ
MCCIERPARFISPAEAVHGASGFLQAGDVMLLASRGGQTAELLPILSICKQKGVTIIAVTENLDSPLASGADIVLQLLVTKEVDRYNMQGTTSFTVLSVLFDALQAALIEETGFQSEQFACIHPGGAVGARLNHTGQP